MRFRAIVATLCALGVLASGCSPSSGKKTLTVFAAASLQQSFRDIEARVEAQHPELDVVISYDGSQNLVDQLRAGARADVLATADASSMTRAEESLQLSSTPFASNSLVLITQPGNPLHLEAADQKLNDIKTVVCAPAVPCGNATQQVFSQFSWSLRPVSEEQKVTDVVGKVRSGQADAGVVYRTDAEGFHVVEIAGADSVRNVYKIANVSGPNPFTDFVLSDEGVAIFDRYGFGSR